MNYLNLALEAWRQGHELRCRRSRYKRYTYGRQWDDLVPDGSGNMRHEGTYASDSGFKPMTNNMIRQLVKCVIGNFRSSLADNDPAAKAAIPAPTAERNCLHELDCRMLEEFLISGCAIQRVVTERRMAGNGVWVDNVSPDTFFINSFSDPRGLDIELAGMLHSMSLREVIMRFARGDTGKARHITGIYTQLRDNAAACPIGDAVSHTFFNAPAGRCRVIEVWTLESRNIIKCHDTESAAYYVTGAGREPDIAAENKRREDEGRAPIATAPRTTMRWHCRFFAPDGQILDEFDSPYRHGMHPFAVKFYPLTDGEVHSFVEDIIDQQRYINRLITLIDHIMSVSAKGVLLFPADQKPDYMTWEELGRRWAECDSIIPYERGYGTGEPKQIIHSGEHAGAYHLLDIQMQLFQQISGVSGALQGQLPGYHTSAALYDSQVRNSAIAILDLIDTFNAFRLQRNLLIARS